MKIRKEKVKANHLYDINPFEVTLTKSPAVPGAGFVVVKSMNAEELEKKEGVTKFSKNIIFKAIDDEKQMVYGYVLVPDVIDLQEDVVTKTDIEVAAHNFMKNLAFKKAEGTGTGNEHKLFEGIGYPLESAIDIDGSIAKSHGAAEGVPGGWWLGTKVEDANVWKSVKDGNITGYSIGGIGKREPTEIEVTKEHKVANKQTDKIQKRLEALVEKFHQTVLNKAIDYNTAINDDKVVDQLIEKMFALMDSFWSIIDDGDVGDKVSALEKSVDQFKSDLENMKTKKSNDTQGEIEMTTEQLNALNEKLNGLVTKVNDLEKKVTPEVKKVEMTPEEKVIADAEIAKKAADEAAIKTLTEKIDGLVTKVSGLATKVDTIEKTTALPNGESNPTETTPEVKSGVVKKGVEISGTALSFRV